MLPFLSFLSVQVTSGWIIGDLCQELENEISCRQRFAGLWTPPLCFLPPILCRKLLAFLTRKGKKRHIKSECWNTTTKWMVHQFCLLLASWTWMSKICVLNDLLTIRNKRKDMFSIYEYKNFQLSVSFLCILGKFLPLFITMKANNIIRKSEKALLVALNIYFDGYFASTFNRK